MTIDQSAFLRSTAPAEAGLSGSAGVRRAAQEALFRDLLTTATATRRESPLPTSPRQERAETADRTAAASSDERRQETRRSDSPAPRQDAARSENSRDRQPSRETEARDNAPRSTAASGSEKSPNPATESVPADATASGSQARDAETAEAEDLSPEIVPDDGLTADSQATLEGADGEPADTDLEDEEEVDVAIAAVVGDAEAQEVEAEGQSPEGDEVAAATRTAAQAGDALAAEARADRALRQRAERIARANAEAGERHGRMAEAAIDKRRDEAGQLQASQGKRQEAALLAGLADGEMDPEVDALIRLFGGRAGAAGAAGQAGVGEPLAGLAGLNGTAGTAMQKAGQAAASTGARTPPAAMEQVVLRLQRAVAEGTDRLRLQLRPASLGKLDIQIDISSTDSRTQIVVSVEKPETYVLLQRDARALEEALRQAGLQLDEGSLSFNLQREGEGSADGRAPEDDRPANDGEEAEAGNSEPDDDLARIARMLSVPGSLDLRV